MPIKARFSVPPLRSTISCAIRFTQRAIASASRAVDGFALIGSILLTLATTLLCSYRAKRTRGVNRAHRLAPASEAQRHTWAKKYPDAGATGSQ
jgi:hypothetical protein